MSDNPVIFISYSHKDRAELAYVREHLGSLAGLGLVTIWDDNELQIGDDWKGNINSAIDACKIFILLVSRHSLGSKFIREIEVPRMLPRWQAKQARFCPIVVSPCHMDSFWWLDKPNRRPKEGKALSELPEPQRDREMATIVAQIEKQIESAVEAPDGPTAHPASAKLTARVIDYSRLPETPYKTLVGRDDELTELDEAWFDKQTNIVSLIAWGGAGKTSLTNEWLVRLQQADYRDADAVLGWSFYSQGTKERATSADIFLDWALERLGITGVAANAAAKGEALARVLGSRRVLLVLDGIEPLQHGPGEQEGSLKDLGLRVLLRSFAMTPPSAAHGLIVLTSRLEIRDLAKFRRALTRPGPAYVIDLNRLSDEAGAALLSDNGIIGTQRQLRETAHDFDGHALALSLLASYLAEVHGGDVRRRDRVRALLAGAENAGHGHARRVMASYDSEWLKVGPVLKFAARRLGPKYMPRTYEKLVLRAVLALVGLFDRPATGTCLGALRSEPAVRGLTDVLVDLSEDKWKFAIARLRKSRLLDPEDPSSPDALDAHPLVREWFGERLRNTNEPAWRAAHGRLYEYLFDATKEGTAPTLEELAPLYQAVAHGCRAGRLQESLTNIYIDRIQRLRTGERIFYYSKVKLGAFGSDLAALSWFFQRPFETVASGIASNQHIWLFAEAAACLAATGRLEESLSARRAAITLLDPEADLERAASEISNLSQTELLVGHVSEALAAAERSIAYADETQSQFRILSRTDLIDAHAAAGSAEDVYSSYDEVEKLASGAFSKQGILWSLTLYGYIDFLISTDWKLALDKLGRLAVGQGDLSPTLRSAALDGLARARISYRETLALSQGAHARGLDVDLFDPVVAKLQQSGDSADFVRGLLARAAFRCRIGDMVGSSRDLDEVEEIAEPGPMRLILCELALERARLAFAQIEAFAPLNGMLAKDNPPKPVVPSSDQIAKLTVEAGNQIKIADDYIQSCGYHRRDEELAELKDVLAGKRTFASLPPRV